MLNLYRISQDVNDGDNTYDSAVVAAESADDARTFHPDGSQAFPCRPWDMWANCVEEVQVDLIGTAAPEIARGVLCASFNGGFA